MPKPKLKPAPSVEYKAAAGSSLSDHDACAIALFLNKYYPNGATPEEVLNACELPDAPPELKKHFEWNDKKAAKRYRINQARQILRSIHVVILTDGKPVESRAYHAVVPTGEPNRRYVPMQVVWNRPDYTTQVIEAARVEMESWIARYQSYQKLAVAVRAAKGILNKIPRAP